MPIIYFQEGIDRVLKIMIREFCGERDVPNGRKTLGDV
jgi:hypothetical protein